MDQAALDILRRASPFDPFPNEIANDYDTLRFAYKWLFTQDVVAAQAAANQAFSVHAGCARVRQDGY